MLDSGPPQDRSFQGTMGDSSLGKVTSGSDLCQLTASSVLLDTFLNISGLETLSVLASLTFFQSLIDQMF